jgi:diguanylate cyclase (GGDEF)-like protein
MRIPFRFKMNLVCVAGLVILATGAIALFSKAWVDLSRAYGLLAINARLASQENLATGLEAGEWALEFRQADTKLNWLRPPANVDAAGLNQIGAGIRESVLSTRLARGSFETRLNPANPETSYFVAFREGANGSRIAAATAAHRSLWDLSAWAAPFLGFFAAALLVTTVAILAITSRLSRSYVLLANAMRNVGAGRLENLDLPESDDGDVGTLTASLRDMVQILSEKEKKISEVSQLADEDPMTGMKNYRAFTNYLTSLFEKYQFKSDAFPVLAIVDLDFFKKVNDNYGHQTGDFVLRRTSALIKQTIRLDGQPGRIPDFCGRYGGEEFVVIFSECQERSMHLGPLRLMKSIKAAPLKIPAEINEKGVEVELLVSASVGIAAWDSKRFKTKEEWIKEADAALYEAKRRGRARLVRVHPELQEWV